MKIGLVHICDRSTQFYEALANSQLNVSFHSAPYFAFPENDERRLPQQKYRNIPCIELVSYFLTHINSGSSPRISHKITIKIINLVNSLPNLMHLFDRTIHSNLGIGDRTLLAIRLCIAMYDFVEASRTDVVIFGIVPHHPWDFLFFKICELCGARVFFAICYPFTGRGCFIFDSSYSVMEPIADVQSRIDSDFLCLNVAKRLYTSMGCAPKGAKGATSVMDRLYGGVESVGSIDLEFIKNSAFALNIINWDQVSEYVIFALHYEPELATNPLGGLFWDQRLAIIALRNSLPEKTLLLLKEHPYWGDVSSREYAKYRGREFFSSIESTLPIAYMSYEHKISSYLNSCLAVCTLSGTTPLECLAMGVPSITMGITPYGMLDGIVPFGPNVYNDVLDSLCRISVTKPFERLRPLFSNIWHFLPYGSSSEIVAMDSAHSATNSEVMAASIASLSMGRYRVRDS